MRILTVFTIFGWALVSAASVGLGHAQDGAGGEWLAPPEKGAPWRHAGTDTQWAHRIGDHVLRAEYRFKDGSGGFLRYESQESGSRLDIYLISQPEIRLKTLGGVKVVINQELQRVALDLEQMKREGRYKNVRFGEVVSGEIDLWQAPAIPLVARMDELIKPMKGEEGTQEVSLLQWTCVVPIGGYLVTFRQVRAAKPGAQEAMAGLAMPLFRVLKEPALRRAVIPLMKRWLTAPFSPDADAELGTVLAFLKDNPSVPVALPEGSLGVWVIEASQTAAQLGQSLLGAYLVGAGLSALEGSSQSLVEAGASEVLKMGRELQARQPSLRLTSFTEFERACAQGRGGAWLTHTRLGR